MSIEQPADLPCVAGIYSLAFVERHFKHVIASVARWRRRSEFPPEEKSSSQDLPLMVVCPSIRDLFFADHRVLNSFVFLDTTGSTRMNFGRLPLIVTDGFEFYQKVIRRFSIREWGSVASYLTSHRLCRRSLGRLRAMETHIAVLHLVAYSGEEWNSGASAVKCWRLPCNPFAC